VLRGVAAGADLAARAGWLSDGSRMPGIRLVAPAVDPERLVSVGEVVGLGEGLVEGRVRVLEVDRGEGRSAWVVVVPGTQHWNPRPGGNPFDLTTDVRAMVGEPTVAAAGVVLALDLARSRSGRSTDGDPVLLVGHSQGGILAAALASDPGFVARHAVTHVVTTGAPVGAFPIPPGVQVLSVEHASDPVPALDLTPNPVRPSWVTVRTQGRGPPLHVSSHALHAYVETVAAAEEAPLGRVTGIEGMLGWRASAGSFLGGSVRSVSEVEVERGWQNPRS
jgi:pimeloyl-ACP methyl ester carboxylesterase